MNRVLKRCKTSKYNHGCQSVVQIKFKWFLFDIEFQSSCSFISHVTDIPFYVTFVITCEKFTTCLATAEMKTVMKNT